MAKNALQKHLRANPKAKKHEGVIRDTIKALKSLKDSGFTQSEYTLGSPYGGSRNPQDSPTRKVAPGSKMTYCA